MVDFAALISDLIYRVTELERRNANIMRSGTVSEFDEKTGMARVETGGLTSALLPTLQWAGKFSSWVPMSKGQQVHLFSPSGEVGAGWIIPAGYSDDHKPPHDKGDELCFALGKTRFVMSAKGLEIAAETISFSGNVKISGEKLEHNQKNIGDKHRHADVKQGGDETGQPV